MSTIGNLVVNFLGNTKPLQTSLSSVKSMVGGFAGTIAGLLGAGVSIEAAREDIAAQKKLQAVLTATGGAAGVTTMEIRELANSLQATTNFADETTVAAAAVLATFKTIKGDQFKETLKIAQDMATVFDMDLTSATTKLGKALKDPISGLASLHKVGIAFTEDQKKLIKTMVESGDTMGAQKYILETLKGSFGGAAEAMASPFKILQNLINDVGEEIGKSLLVPMKYLAQTAIPFLKNWGTEIAKVATTVLVFAGVMRALTVAQKAVAIGQTLILSLGGPAGWAALATGALVFAAGLKLVNNQFGEMQAGMDAMQGKFAQVADAARRDAAFFRELGDKPAAKDDQERERKRLNDQFNPQFLSDQLKEAATAFGGEANVPWFVREGIIEKFTGAEAAIKKLKDEIRELSGVSKSQMDIEKLWAADNGLSVEKKKEIEDLIRQRDEAGKNRDMMKAMRDDAKQLTADMMTPIEKAENAIAKAQTLFDQGLIDATTRDRAIAKANEDALGKNKHASDGTAANEIGSKEAFSSIFAAMRTGQGSVQDKILDVNQRQLALDEKELEFQERIAKSVEKFGTVEFGVAEV